MPQKWESFRIFREGCLVRQLYLQQVFKPKMNTQKEAAANFRFASASKYLSVIVFLSPGGICGIRLGAQT